LFSKLVFSWEPFFFCLASLSPLLCSDLWECPATFCFALPCFPFFFCSNGSFSQSCFELGFFTKVMSHSTCFFFFGRFLNRCLRSHRGPFFPSFFCVRRPCVHFFSYTTSNPFPMKREGVLGYILVNPFLLSEV